MQMKSFDEKTLVEDYLVGGLQEVGWRFVPAAELERTDLEEPLLIPNLFRALERINKDLGITGEEIQKAINKLKLTGRGPDGARQVLRFSRHGVPIKLEKERVVKYLSLFDQDHPENNEFIVTRQVINKGVETIRSDMVLYVNGIPLVDIECKSPVALSQSWVNAYCQIKEYERNVPELFKYVQIGVAAERTARYFPIVPWLEDVHTYQWRAEDRDPLDSVVDVLKPQTLLDMVTNFTFFREEKGERTKVIARYMQYRAANRIVDRVLRCMRGEETKNRGLIWHWQGSGKTLTMIFAAHKLFYMKEMENPSMFFIVDRMELEEQLFEDFSALDILEPEVIGSIAELEEVLRHDGYRGKRGVFVTLVHKFRPGELQELQEEMARLSRERETILDRENVVLFVDEGHRSQYGLMATQMWSIFKKAFAFAFTGTPIAKVGRDTYREFAYPPEELYLDRYFVVDALRDGFTVKIVYQPRLEGDLHLRKDLLEAFWEAETDELPEHRKAELEERISHQLDAIRVFLENPERIEVVAQDMARHFRGNLEGKFKAMVVTASRKACVHYKRELDRHLPPEYTQVVMSYLAEEEETIRSYKRELFKTFPGRDLKSINKELVRRFKEEELPRILVVTNMLLTGFDATVLQTMYLDKPLKEHRLLQAIARTNRPYGDVKEAGLVIDYVGVLKDLKKAFEIYTKEDLHGVLEDYSLLREEFTSHLRKLAGMFRGILGDYGRDSLLEALERVTSDEEAERRFVKEYKALRRIFEMLGPDEIKLENLEDYKWLSAIYAYCLKEAIRKEEDPEIARFFRKTVQFIHKTTEIEELKELPTLEFDENYLRRLEEKVKSEREKAANVLFTLNRLVLVERSKDPIYESLVDRVEGLVKLWRQKVKDYNRIYQEGARIIEALNRLSERQKRLGISDAEYGLLLALEEELGEREELIEEIKGLYQGVSPWLIPGWVTQSSLRKRVEERVRAYMRKAKARYGLSLDEMNRLHNKLMERLENYGV
jgi:type I restriction enzyme R subunit